MESEYAQDSVPLHPWEGSTPMPFDAEDDSASANAVDPVGPGHVDQEAVGSWADEISARHSTPGVPTADFAQVLYGAGLTAEQVIDTLRSLRSARPDLPALATRLTPDVLDAVQLEFPSAAIHEIAQTCVLGELAPARGQVCVVAAGRADAAVAHEAAVCARVFGAAVELLPEVSDAEVDGLLTATDHLSTADCIVVVSGMEGSLPSVIGRHTSLPVVAVPTSVGYGASFGGMAALLTMLNASAPGVVVCNVDNGFGAGVFAARVARRSHRARVTVEAPTAG